MAEERAGGAGAEQPHETLNRAAALLEQMAGKATQGPWRSHDTHLDLGGHTATVLTGEPKVVGKPCGNPTRLIAWLPSMSNEPWDQERNVWNDSRWIAMMDPAVAAPLALWLRTDAKRCKSDMAAWGSPKNAVTFAEERYAGALAFARMMLGEG